MIYEILMIMNMMYFSFFLVIDIDFMCQFSNITNKNCTLIFSYGVKNDTKSLKLFTIFFLWHKNILSSFFMRLFCLCCHFCHFGVISPTNHLRRIYNTECTILFVLHEYDTKIRYHVDMVVYCPK